VLLIPAIDLKDKKCVRLRQGKEEDLTIFNDNPVKQAQFFEKSGCKRIHIVDLDSAFGRPNINKDIILEIRKNTNIEIELGGGINKKEIVSFWLNNGINYLIVGSLAIKNKKLTLNLSENFKNKIYIAIDILKNKMMINGWAEDSGLNSERITNHYDKSEIKGYIFTDISRDGMLEGLNIQLIKNFLIKVKKNAIVGGGLSNYDDLNNLQELNLHNLEGVIAGKSFYTGNIKIDKALKIIDKDA
tara:strand:+ start:1395 stop:2126 length:732 start_codon:yes stop_codon:yes gene_type:complete